MIGVSASEQPLDPFPGYEKMRKSQPVFRDPQSGVWHVFRYDDVQRVLSEHVTFSSRMGGENPSETGQLFAASLINTDPPRHRQLRSLVTQAFTPRAVEALAPRIFDITNELLAPAISAGAMDLIKDVAYPLPVIVIAELMGIPAGDRDRFKKWSDAIVSQTRPETDEHHHDDANHEMADYFLGMIEERRRRPGNDLISRLLAAQIEGEHLSVVELLGFCSLLLVAGNETTTNLIGNAVLCFSEDPGTIPRLAAEPSLLPEAVEEVLRYLSRSNRCIASRPPIHRSASTKSPPVRPSSPGSGQRTGTRSIFCIRTFSTSGEPPTATWPLARASTSVSGHRSPGWKPGLHCRPSSTACPGWRWHRVRIWNGWTVPSFTV
ncbi:putative cytochrome P450 YjiB [Arthrobacter sp. SO5]|nr:putative cytochrome P450 YjiB [Arthrobacter sp. SO5]